MGSFHQGTLSPSLFALLTEPLTAAIRSNSNIKGIIKGETEYKISLYADDLLLFFLQDPNASLHSNIQGYQQRLHTFQLHNKVDQIHHPPNP